MKRTVCIFLAFVCLTGTIAIVGQQNNWIVRLSLPQNEYLPGEPIIGLRIEIENVGPNPSPFPGFKGNLFLDEAKTPCKWEGLCVDTIPVDPNTHIAKAAPKIELVGSIHSDTWASNIAAYCGLSEKQANFYGMHTLTYRFHEQSEVRVSEGYVQFTIAKPTGKDLEAYEYFKGDPLKSENYKELLKKYPTSTYAAYLVYDRLKGFASADFTNPGFLRSLETGLFLSNSYPTENGWMEMKDEMNAAWWSKWAGIILKNHPDIWFADELRLRLAMNQVALKNYQAAEADFIKLSKEAKPYIAEKAGLFVEIMKQKGWVSAPVEKSVPEAKEER